MLQGTSSKSIQSIRTLGLFDFLTKPEIKLTDKKGGQVKDAPRELLETSKHEKIVLDWRKRQQTRAEVRVTIEKVLGAGSVTPTLRIHFLDQICGQDKKINSLTESSGPLGVARSMG